MPIDATPIVQPPADSIVGINIDWMHICPEDQLITYTLVDVYQSGKKVVRPAVTVAAEDFVACFGSFGQAGARKKFLTWLVANGYEPGLAIT